jgi:hypothetical protein
VRTTLRYLVIPSVSRGIPLQKLKGYFLGIPRLTLGMTNVSRRPFIVGVILVLFFGQASFADNPVFGSGPKRVQLLELFTSEGCSSCPPAEAALSKLVNDPRLWREFVPIAFHVHYWDRLGWKDPFASAEWTKRQQIYAASWNAESMYTPAFVLDGREWRGANIPVTDEKAVGILKVAVQANDKFLVSFAPASGNDALDVECYIARLGFGIEMAVHAGENNGRKLHHDFVVLDLAHAKLGSSPQEFRLPVKGANPPSRTALAAWVTKEGDTRPLQAVGGWLP